MVWCFARLFIKGASGRQRYNVLGAIDSHTKELISIRTADYINSITVTQLIDLIREKHPTQKITLVLDNARYQRCYLVQNYAAEKTSNYCFFQPILQT